MSFAAELGQHLRTSGFSGVYVGYRPPEPDQVIVLIDTPSIAPETTFAMETNRVQVTVRASGFDYPAASLLAQRVFVEIHGYPSLASTELSPPARFLAIRALQNPFLMEYDDHDRPVFAFNLEANYTW